MPASIPLAAATRTCWRARWLGSTATATRRRVAAGDIWTWTAIDAYTKLVVSWYVGHRDGEAARTFINDLAGRLAGRVQLTSDGHKAYLEAVEEAFGDDVDYARLVKLYGPSADGAAGTSSPT